MIKELDFFNVYRVVIRTLSDIYDRVHCMKSVQIQSYFWSVFSCIWIEYEDLRSIQSEYRKIRTRNNSVFGDFSHSGYSATKSLYFHKRAPSYTFDRVPDTSLTWQKYMSVYIYIYRGTQEQRHRTVYNPTHAVEERLERH